ncbi:Hsp70 family protein [Mycobacterium spongiae]|uniref:Hsp70 family protein n=1 Tax=Mycobacterium spongiae TaxID=886343 RepID=A0A975PVE8_9MYCO|nr:Hsp70 family protein [Mycobacterium spongiae]QUR66086.1 Hsp70 family protein [Mycobacterium spongiae]
MTESLGLSIGVANLVAARVGRDPVARASVLRLFDRRAAEVGLPEQNPSPAEPNLVLRGFVERVGDHAPLVAADGTKYHGEALTVQALDAMARAVGYGAPIMVATPAYWSEHQVAALREALIAQPGLSPDGVSPGLISDAAAALSAVRTRAGLPAAGVVVLCDFGAGGTSVTLAHPPSRAADDLQTIGPTVRYREFSGDDIDQLIVNHVLTTVPDADATDTSGTATRMGSLTRLLGHCRRAKEQLSTATMATIATSPVGAAGLPSSGNDVRLSRGEFEQLISDPLDHFATAVEDMLQRNGIPPATVAAVATVGGGASIPLIETRLSERLHVPVLTVAEPMFTAAIGAALIGQEQSAASAPTGAGSAVDAPTNIVGGIGSATEVSPTAWANRAASAAANESASDNDASATYRALAWSEDTATGNEPVPYTGPDATGEYTRDATTTDYAPAYGQADRDRSGAEPEQLPWYQRAAVIFGLAAAGVAILIAAVLALTLGTDNSTPVNTSSPEPVPPPSPETVTVTGQDHLPTVTVITPSPTATPPSAITTTSQPVTTTTTTGTTTATTTTTAASTTTAPPTTTTAPSTTTAPPTTSSQATTTAPPTTTQPTTTAAPITPTSAASGQ